jgi:PAS domain S-box-containing protein
VRVDETGSGEVADLGRAFNGMATSLEHGREELESQNSELEAQQGQLQRAVEELAEEKARVERFYRIGRALSGATELEDVAATVVEQLAELAHADLGAVYVYMSAGDEVAPCIAALGMTKAELQPAQANVGLAGSALASRRTIATALGESGITVRAMAGDLVVRHEVHVPLVNASEVVGIVTLARTADRPFHPSEIEQLDYKAGRAGASIANALALRAVRDQAALNRAVLETAADAFVSINSNSTVTGWNPAAERLFGWTAAEAVGRSLPELIIPERMREVHQTGLEYVVRTGDSRLAGRQVELVAAHRDGHELPVEMIMSPLERGGELTFNAFLRDISERKRAELYMVAQYAVTRVLSEASTVEDARAGIVQALGVALDWQAGSTWTVDDEAEVLRPTAFWAADGVEADAFREHTLGSVHARGDCMPGQVWETGEATWIDDLAGSADLPLAAAARAAGLHGAICFPVTSGSRFFGVAQFFSAEVEPPDPELLALLATVGAQIGQFSERKRIEQESDRLKDEFFALVSHEFRTPLTSIIGYLELVLEEPDALEPETNRFLQVVERNSRRLHRLVGDLLFVAQVEAGRLSLDRSALPLQRVVGECVEAARPGAEDKGVTLSVRAEPVGTLNGDGDRLGQMLDNLISNAIKFTPEGGRVDVFATRRRGGALVEVRDSGVGIPADEQHRLFERFFRSSTATERAIPGVGLGLTISRAIAEAHGGSITFESEEGRGTTFRVELPLDAQLTTNDPSATPQEVLL